jgi:Spy/CpxP family protein refolding chaperone
MSSDGWTGSIVRSRSECPVLNKPPTTFSISFLDVLYMLFLDVLAPCINATHCHSVVTRLLLTLFHPARPLLPFTSSNMSQMHSHGPGQPMHSHGPGPGPQQGGGGQQIQLTPQQIQQLQQMQAQRMQQQQMQQQQAQQQPDPETQAAIDASFREVKFQVGQNNILACEKHNKQKCEVCKVDFTAVNELAARIAQQPNPVPPPPAIVNNQVAQLVAKAKEEGNVCLSIPLLSF